MARNLGTFQLGETLPVRWQTKDEDGDLAAPTSLVFEVTESGEAAATFALGTDSEVETIATGDYQLNFLTTAAGPVKVKTTMVMTSKTIIEYATGYIETL